MHLVKVRGGYLARGRVVESPEQATAYTSPSAAERALQQAIDAGTRVSGRVVPAGNPDAPPPRGADTTGTKRQQALRGRKHRVEAFLDDEAQAEMNAMIESGECADKADAIRQALHEKYLSWMEKKA